MLSLLKRLIFRGNYIDTPDYRLVWRTIMISVGLFLSVPPKIYLRLTNAFKRVETGVFTIQVIIAPNEMFSASNKQLDLSLGCNALYVDGLRRPEVGPAKERGAVWHYQTRLMICRAGVVNVIDNCRWSPAVCWAEKHPTGINCYKVIRGWTPSTVRITRSEVVSLMIIISRNDQYLRWYLYQLLANVETLNIMQRNNTSKLSIAPSTELSHNSPHPCSCGLERRENI